MTGEDVLELHVHGGSATVKAVLAAIPKCSAPGQVRYAAPGEFTQRAFLNNRLDLAQVESSRRYLIRRDGTAAPCRGTGRLRAPREDLRSLARQTTAGSRGDVEALIDFQEDQHFDESPSELLKNVTVLVNEMVEAIMLHEMGSQRSELLRNGIRIALLGPPNAGKELPRLNQIVGREASIVSDEAGTTRDIVEASLDIRGYLCSFADTAGIRTQLSQAAISLPAEGTPVIGSIEEEGIRRARRKALDSDIVIVLASVEPSDNGGYRIGYDLETLQLAAQAPACFWLSSTNATWRIIHR